MADNSDELAARVQIRAREECFQFPFAWRHSSPANFPMS